MATPGLVDDGVPRPRPGAAGRHRTIRAPRAPLARIAVAAVVLVASAGACAGSDTSGSARDAVGGAVRTLGSTPTTAAAVPARLLRVDEVRGFVFLGFDIREQPVLDPKQFAVTTLHGPCGAPVTTPFRAEQGAFKVFRSTISLIIETLAEPGAAAGAEFLAAVRADARPGCPPFEEQIGSAGASQVQLVRMLELPPVGQDRVGWVQEVTAPDGKVGYRTVVVVADGDRVAMLAVLTQSPPEGTQIADLVRTAAAAR